MQLQDNRNHCETIFKYQKHVAGSSLQNICAMTSLICFLGNFLSSAAHRNPPETREFPNADYGEAAEDARACKQIKMQRRKEIESRLRRCSAKTNENSLKVNRQTCLLGFSLPFLGVHFSVFTNGFDYCY